MLPRGSISPPACRIMGWEMVIDPDLGDDGIDEIIRRRHGLLGGDGRGDRAAWRWEGDLAWVGGPALRD